MGKLDIHFSTGTDTWETPPDLFDLYDDHYHFCLDVAAEPLTAKCTQYYTLQDNALVRDWKQDAGFTCDVPPAVWMNPPYSRGNMKQFVAKAYEESAKGLIVVGLIPARTDTALWHQYIWDKKRRTWKEGVHGDLLQGRLKFRMNGMIGDPAPFPSAVIVWDLKKLLDNHPVLV